MSYGGAGTPIVWKREAFAVNENYVDVRDRGGIDAIADQAIQRFREARAEGFEWFSFAPSTIRFIPENPAYKGELARKAGRWAPDVLTTSSANVPHNASDEDVVRAIRHAFEFARTSNGSIGYGGSIDDVAHARTIWFLFYSFEFFKRRPDPRPPRITDEEEPLGPVEPERFRRRPARPRKRRRR